MDIYAASCNPPRRAKRLRADSGPLPPESSPSPSHPDDDDDDNDNDAIPQPPPPKRRGRKPGTMSRAAREAQRKINHSLIEKARRTKINDALATLRQLVPPEYKRAASFEDQDDSDGGDLDPTTAHKSKRQKQRVSSSGEKEFKLEILVRTVAYLQTLTDKVKALERDGCPHCERPISGLTDDSPVGHTHMSVIDEPRPSKPQNLTSQPSRLPSISTWLPALTPSQSPSCDLPSADVGGNNNSLPPTTHLPTPPTSATFPPSSAISAGALPPALTLPSPGTFLPSAALGSARTFPSGFARATSSTNVSGATATGNPNGPNKPMMMMMTVGGNNKKGSPGSSSPTYTPEDETAASLLLRMSTSNSPTISTSPQQQSALGRLRSSSSSSSLAGINSLWPLPSAFESAATATAATAADILNPDYESCRRPDVRFALTPSRLLGLTRRSPPDGR
ncbi:hypothetical protein EDD15DRAFT_2177418 [Pisolithus albus]|nr:hypothetical protein EDD15DRAFT_2177418 [Pisolithus albus]